jgi:hypothetical protein
MAKAAGRRRWQVTHEYLLDGHQWGVRSRRPLTPPGRARGVNYFQDTSTVLLSAAQSRMPAVSRFGGQPELRPNTAISMSIDGEAEGSRGVLRSASAGQTGGPSVARRRRYTLSRGGCGVRRVLVRRRLRWECCSEM